MSQLELEFFLSAAMFDTPCLPVWHRRYLINDPQGYDVNKLIAEAEGDASGVINLQQFTNHMRKRCDTHENSILVDAT